MGKPAVALELSAAERSELESLSRRRHTAQGVAQRARIVLLAADGLENKVIARRVQASSGRGSRGGGEHGRQMAEALRRASPLWPS